MEIVGISNVKNKKGELTTTLHILEEFDQYQNDPENGRTAVGKKAGSVYLGALSVPDLKVGAKIEVYYDRAVMLPDGRQIQTVKKLEILK